MIAQVQPLTTTRRLSGPFDYALPEQPLRVGSIVRVPFGRQALDGVVVGLAEHTELAPERLVAPTGVREDDVPRELVELALWMAAEYCSTPARALQLVLPPRGKPRTEPWAFATGKPQDGERLTDNQRALLEALPLRATGQLPALRRLQARGLVAIPCNPEQFPGAVYVRCPFHNNVARADGSVMQLPPEQQLVQRNGYWEIQR